MTKILIGMLSLALVGVGGLVAAVDGFGDDQTVRSVSIPAGTTTAGTTTSVEDVSGPCDEPEHATDPRCTGAGTTTDGGEDRSGSGHDDDDNDDDEDRSGSNSGSS